MADDPKKPIDKVGMLGDIRIETAYFFPSPNVTQEESAQQENIQSEERTVNSDEQAPTSPQEPRKILESSSGITLNSNISTHATTLSSCQEYLSQLKVSLHRIYRTTSGSTSQISKSDLRNLIKVLSSADELINQLWQEISEEEDEL
ncbi:hypothetical protein IQ250_23570 [Pseudanabaenaceae cyanobacterium LEGE 13415]|nr:hypothetical protein [Pseudanabaenaceae cyanobacterium LEGE 13415]